MKAAWQKFRGWPRWLRFGTVAVTLGLTLMVITVWTWMGSGDETNAEASATSADAFPLLSTPNFQGRYATNPDGRYEQVPDVYLYQHFLRELGLCYEQIGQPVALPKLERQVGREWGMAAQALLDYYGEGHCSESEWHLLIPGRAGWLAAQAAEYARNGGDSVEEGQEQTQ